MSRIAYVNGRYLPHAHAQVHIEDRGFQFADGVYEVCEVRNNALIDETRHINRLDRSLGELRIKWPLARSALSIILREVVARNRVSNGIVYLQVTRGVAPREFYFPPDSVPASLVVTARASNLAAIARNASSGIAIKTHPEQRWARRDIKSVALLPNVLAKQAARENGAFEAWLIDAEGMVTEGASSNAWIVTKAGKLVTRKADNDILRGITRTSLIDLMAREKLVLEERSFTIVEAKAAREAFLSSATTIAMPIVSIDGAQIGDGKPGPVVMRLRAGFHEIAEQAL